MQYHEARDVLPCSGGWERESSAGLYSAHCTQPGKMFPGVAVGTQRHTHTPTHRDTHTDTQAYTCIQTETLHTHTDIAHTHRYALRHTH